MKKKLYVRYLITKGPYTVMSCNYHHGEDFDVMAFAEGIRAALPYRVIKAWGIRIEVRENTSFTRPGRLVRKFA